MHQVARVHAHGRPDRGRPGDDGDPAVVGHVERLVRVGRPRVRGVVAVDQPPQAGRGRCPQAEGTVDVHPCTVVVREGRRRAERVEGTRVQVARLQADDRRPVPGRERHLERVQPDAALVVGGNGRRRSEAQVAQGQVHRAVPLLPDEHPHVRGAGETEPVEVPAAGGEHVLPPRGEAGEVGHRGTGDEADVGVRRQSQQVEHPGRRGLLRGDGARSREAHAAVLVPRRGEPVGGERGGERPADDPAEEAARRHGHQPRLDVPGEQVDHLGGVGRPVRQRTAEAGEDLLGAPLGRDVPRSAGRRATSGRARRHGRGRRCRRQVPRSRRHCAAPPYPTAGPRADPLRRRSRSAGPVRRSAPHTRRGTRPASRRRRPRGSPAGPGGS